MTPRSLLRFALALAAPMLVCACATAGGRSGAEAADRHAHAEAAFPDIGYAAWTDDEPSYRIYPGDELDVSVASAPELNKTVTVRPDGRVSLPLIHAVMVADRTTQEAEDQLAQAYSSQLIRPDVQISVKTVTPLKVFVGGEVDKPGVYDMPGDINALQAVIQAGGFKTTAKRDGVVIIRRSGEGRAMMRTANLGKGISDPGRTDLVPLRRFDIVFVQRTGLASAGVIMQQIKDLVPGNVGFDYAVTNQAKIF